MDGDYIIIGTAADPILTFDRHAIRSISMEFGVDIVGTELSVDETIPTVDYAYTSDSGEFLGGPDFDVIVSSDGYYICTNRTYTDLRKIPYGTLVLYYRDDVLVSKAYLKSVDRIGEGTYRVNAMSAIGLLDTQMHRGNLYQRKWYKNESGANQLRGVSFPDVLAEIIGSSVPYTVSSELNSLQIYGWLPYATKRENLHQLLFACGVMVGRNTDGDMDFRFLSNESATQIPDGRIYIGGNVDYSAPASAVDITEHSYMELVTDETVTEYDNTDGSETANNTLLVFRNAPLHDLQTTGTLTIVSSGVNWAILTGTGILTGKKYTHSTRVMTRYAENADAQRENVVSVTDAYLVNVANSENVAQRVLAYYSSKKTVSTSMVVDGEKPGDLITGTDPYQERISGFISNMTYIVSNIIKAQAKIITDYIPTGGGNNYTQYHLFTGEGNIDWDSLLSSKADGDPVQITLISGGHGGYSGQPGTKGHKGNVFDPSPGTPGEGGAGGNPGEGGRVLTFTTTAGALRSLVSSAYSCGLGGESDTDGGATTLIGRSSSEGAPTPFGVANIFTGEVYATKGTESGVAGGKGNPNGTNVTYRGQTWTPGASGSNDSGHGAWAEGGSGGGPAVGANGGVGGDGEVERDRPGYSGDGGDGGNGATPTIAGDDSTIYGGGGNGGHGGGGAGAGNLGQDNSDKGGTYSVGRNGNPGQGGPGGKGGPGLIIIYT